jgi:hypothetical protein
MDGTEARRACERERKRRTRAAGVRCVCVQCSVEFLSTTCNAKYCSHCTTNRAGTCEDCGGGFLFRCRRGAVPRRCKDCSASRARKLKRKYLQRNPREKRTTSSRVEQCKRCRSQFSCRSRGPAPQLCEACRGEVGSLCVHRVECKQCKRVTWKRLSGEFCSRACHADHERRRGYEHPCKQCGKPFRCQPSDVRVGRSYCSDQCREVAWNQVKTCTCLVCGEKFAPKHNTANKCCSRECGWKLRSLATAASRSLRNVRDWVKRIQRKYIREQRRKAAESANEEKRMSLRPCVRCGKLFVNGRDKLCSTECRKESRRINKRCGSKRKIASSHADRCAIRGLPCDSSVTKSFVHERDGWKCMLCGEQTVQGDRRKAPTLGHIVPLNNPLNLTHGHVASNTFTNCASCNGKQGNAVIIDGHQNYADPRAAYLEHIARTGYPLRSACHDAESPKALRREFLTGFPENGASHGPPRTIA